MSANIGLDCTRHSRKNRQYQVDRQPGMQRTASDGRGRKKPGVREQTRAPRPRARRASQSIRRQEAADNKAAAPLVGRWSRAPPGGQFAGAGHHERRAPRQARSELITL